MDYYLKALDHAQFKNNIVLLGRIHLDIGDILLIQRDYRASRQKYKQAYEYFTTARFHPQAFYSLLNIGRTYHAAKVYKRAQKFYLYIYRFVKDSLQKGSLLQELAINLYDDREFDSAMVYFRKVIINRYFDF